MQVDDQRLTRKDAVFDNVKILNGNQIPLTNTLTGKLPLRGSLIALKSGNIHDLYYGDGLQWVPITDGGSTADPPLVEVLAAGNVTGGHDIVISGTDEIISETDGSLTLRSIGSGSQILIESQGTGINALDIHSLGEVNIDSANGQAINIISNDQLILQTSSTAANALLLNVGNTTGGIDINAGSGTGGIDMDAGGQIAITSSQNTLDAVRIEATDVDDDGGITLAAPVTTIGSTSAHIYTTQSDSMSFTNVTPLDNVNDVTGRIQINDMSLVATINFSRPYPVAPSVFITPRNISTAQAVPYVSSIGPSQFQISTVSGGDSQGSVSYFVIGYV